jgi:SAM-dependent methyltransferase
MREPDFLGATRASYDAVAADYAVRFRDELDPRPSARMVATARQAYPALRFEVGSMLALDLPDGGLGGVLAWYSVIHIPDEQLAAAFAEFRRVLAPGGYLQLGFQVGDEPVHRTQALGHAICLDFHQRQPDQVARRLAGAGLEVRARLLREPETGGDFPERTQQAFLLARKAARPEPAAAP